MRISDFVAVAWYNLGVEGGAEVLCSDRGCWKQLDDTCTALPGAAEDEAPRHSGWAETLVALAVPPVRRS